MPKGEYVPERGDFVWIDLNPRSGHEQSGLRPARVLSPRLDNRRTGLCVICPATRQAKGYAFEVSQPTRDGTPSVILADHVRCVDWRTRRARLIQQADDAVLQEVVAKLEALIIHPDL